MLKQGLEQARKAGLPAGSSGLGNRKRGAQAAQAADCDQEREVDSTSDDNDDGHDRGRPTQRRELTAHSTISRIVMRMYIVDTQYLDDTIPGAVPTASRCAAGQKSQLIILKEASIEAVYTAIKSRIDPRRAVRTMYVAVTKPDAAGGTPTDVERITSDEDLESFLEVARTEYKPHCIQVQLAPSDGGAQTPPPNDRAYIPREQFVRPDPATQYDVPVSDSENERYLRTTGKGKKKTWPKGNGMPHLGFTPYACI